MPPNSQNNLMSLETFRKKLGYNPWFFWQLSNLQVPLTSNSKTLLREYAWQMGDSAGREEIRVAIASAERKLRQYLGYDVDVRYRSQTLDTNDSGLATFYQVPGIGQYPANYVNNTNLPGFPLELNVGKIKRVATKTYVEIGSATVAYSDLDNDTLKESFTADYTGDSTTDVSQVVAAVSVADRTYLPEKEDVLSEWLIRPVKVSRPTGQSNVIRVQGSSWLLTKPMLYEGVLNAPGYSNSTGVNSSGAFDPNSNTPSPMLTTITLYRSVYSAENNAVVNLYNRGTGALINSYNIPTFFTSEMQRKLGYVSLNWYELGNALYGCQNAAATCSYPGTNVELVINYEAGAGYRQQDEIADWQTTVYRLACSELKKSIAGSDQANAETTYWQRNLAKVLQGENAYRIDNQDLKCPWGTTQGAIDAWNMVKELAIQKSVTV